MFSEDKKCVVLIAQKWGTLLKHHELFVFLQPSQSQSCCIHLHSIGIDWKGLKRDSGN